MYGFIAFWLFRINQDQAKILDIAMQICIMNYKIYVFAMFKNYIINETNFVNYNALFFVKFTTFHQIFKELFVKRFSGNICFIIFKYTTYDILPFIRFLKGRLR